MSFGIIVKDVRSEDGRRVNWEALAPFLSAISLKFSKVPKIQHGGKITITPTHIPSPTSYMDDQTVRDLVFDISETADLALRLFAGAKKPALLWMVDSNTYFFGKSPIEMILVGKVDAVKETLEDWME